ncbi:MAG TPA: peroxiredoxin-like family protein [Spirochaetia bacterium]|nr:peroxiredoxin-like family protein [Spirochaetia bacterium]
MGLHQEFKRITQEVTQGFNPEQKLLFESFVREIAEVGLQLKPLGTGEEIPSFTLPDALGRPVNSTDLLVKGPLVIVFYRGAWCPWCNVQLKGIQDNLEEIQQLGAQLVAISPMTPDDSLSLAEKHGLEYPVLSDRGLKIAREFGLVYPLDEAMQTFHQTIGVDLIRWNGSGTVELPVPATYVVDHDGIVVSRVDPDWRDRMDPLEIIAALQKLGR